MSEEREHYISLAGPKTFGMMRVQFQGTLAVFRRHILAYPDILSCMQYSTDCNDDLS